MGEIAPQEQFHLLSTIFYYLVLNFYVKKGIRFSLRDKRLFEITEVEITRVDCILLSIIIMLRIQFFVRNLKLKRNIFLNESVVRK